jgi:hypothetical protein
MSKLPRPSSLGKAPTRNEKLKLSSRSEDKLKMKEESPRKEVKRGFYK